MNKVAHITLLFWIMKIRATTLGETAGDLLSMTLGIGYAARSLVLVAVLAVAAVVRRPAHDLAGVALRRRFAGVDPIRTRRAAIFYWTAIVFSNTLGTALGD